MKRRRRSLAPGALAILGCYVVGRSGGWLVAQVASHVGPTQATWYEGVIVLIGVAMMLAAGVAIVGLTLGVFDD